MAGRIGIDLIGARAATEAYVDNVASVLKGETVTITVGTGGDHATLGGALEAASRYRPLFDAGAVSEVEISLLSGFVMAEQIHVVGLDLAFVTVSSEDAEVTIDRSALTNNYGLTYYPAWCGHHGAVLPVIDVLFDMDDSGDATDRAGVDLKSGSKAIFVNGSGIKNAPSRGANIHEESTLVARGANFSHSGTYGVRVANGATAFLRDADLSNAGQRGLAASAAVVQATGADCSEAGHYGIRATGSSIVHASGADVSGAGLAPLSIGTRSIVNIDGASGARRTGIQLLDSAMLTSTGDRIIRINEDTGHDDNDGQFTRPVASWGRVLEMLPRYIEHDYIVRVESDVEEILHLTSRTVSGPNAHLRIQLDGFSIAGVVLYGVSGSKRGGTVVEASENYAISVRGGTVDGPLEAHGCRFVVFRQLEVYNPGGPAVLFSSSRGQVRDIDFGIDVAEDGLLAQDGSAVMARDLSGNATRYGISSEMLSLVQTVSGTPTGSTADLNESTGGKINP